MKFIAMSVICFSWACAYAESLLLVRDPSPVQLPQDCLRQSGVCSVFVDASHRFEVKWDKINFVLGENTILVRQGAASLRLLSGVIWVKSSEIELTLETPYGTVLCGESCFAEIHEKRVEVIASVHEIRLRPRGTGEEVVVLPGFTNWLGMVDSRGQSSVGFPVAYDLPKFIHDLARLQSGQRKNFAHQIEEFVEPWKQAVELGSKLARDLASVRQEEYDEVKAKQNAQRLKALQEQQRLRKMFREKTSFIE